ncbi:Serpentine Receptor, class I [Caenorhabditis elegans]|uniref:Serpentine Receptor, class I n=1 Tax=Caenorhabditis elegans TaxID=6239 RepID=Q965L7_CAEEL|nr:Serpentine Receptor, class I [Caenorhabditis elegans]CCD69864.1 Serpentine Receptor, class I [Caenorhabditis elegans]|eukprot:NP_001293510.1 Serpentine Receptor, class I [Caenorhabditis elegans]
MYDIDFATPNWLITYYHVIGIISLLFDSFSIYLILFKSSKIDNFRYFLLNFQLTCTATDIILTFFMQPVPLYPLVSGYILGFLAQFGASTHFCLTMVIATIIYQIESMVFCFVRKHQTIATTLKKYLMPRWLIWCLFSFFAFDICVVVGLFSQTCIDQDLQMEYVRVNFPDYLPGFQSLPNFSIYEADAFFVGTVVFAVTCGIISFFILCIILANIFRMLSLLKSQISASNYRKHRAAIWSLLAQFATSSVCVVPPIFFVFVVLIGIDGAQVIVEFLLVIACLHSSFNVTVLVFTFPPYRKYVFSLIKREKRIERIGVSVLSLKPSSIVVPHLN